MINETKKSRVARIDGPAKVTGQAQYTSDHNFPRLAYAVPICAKIAKGKVVKFDATAAKKMKGVIDVFTRENIGPLYRPSGGAGMMDYRTDEPRPPFEDDVISYYGQYIGVAVAETFELAQNAARSVKVTYAAETPNLDPDFKQETLKKTDVERGHAESSFEKSQAKIDQTYTTPGEVHNPIELHATVANWESPTELVLYETSQAINSARNVISQVLGIPRENLRVITKYLGSGFGGKLWAWPHSTIAAAASRQIKRPVKLVIDRHMSFTNVGHRPRTQQRIRISSDSSGELKALMHDYATQGSMFSEYKENCGEVSGFLYKIPDVRVTSGVARRNQSVPTSMRGPGAVPGLFALESALDELAVQLKMDPAQLRLKNDILVDQTVNKKFSSRHLKECIELGSQKFGWDKRNPVIGSMKDGEEILGWGMACCTWQFSRLDAEATFKFLNNEKVSLSCGTHDIGTGMYTVLAKIVSEETGLPFESIEINIGDTALPKGPLAGGSMATGSVIPAVVEAVRAGIKNMKTALTKVPSSPLVGKKEDEIKYERGRFDGLTFGQLLHKINMASMAGMGSSKSNFTTKDKEEFSTKSFGAQFVEVGWTPEIAKLRVRRVVTVIDAGRIINYRQARNQIEGAVVMGIGMGMFEEAIYDKRDGNCVNNSLADYVMAVHADCPSLDVAFLDYPDKAANEYGARGVGEIGLAGVAAGITNAVYHATGIRVRDLPVTIEKLLV